MANIFKYQEKDLLGGWLIEVRKGRGHLGNIRRNPSNGKFQYYPGSNNILTVTFEEDDLDVLKRRIESKLF